MPPPFSISSIFKPGSCHSSEMGNMSKQRQTALALVDAMNRCDTRTVFELRERNAPREIYPRALGSKVQDDDGVRNTLNLFRNVFKSLDLVVHEIIEDIPNRKVCMWIYADGVTVTGRYTNEHVWNLHFNLHPCIATTSCFCRYIQQFAPWSPADPLAPQGLESMYSLQLDSHLLLFARAQPRLRYYSG